MLVLLDACILYPPAIRDLFMWLAAEMLYSPRWTETIHDEWMRNVLKDRPELTQDKLFRTRQLMDQIDPQCLVSGYERHIPSLELPDANDRHVLAAAIEGKASFIITFNLPDFPEKTLAQFNIQALHPDIFLSKLLKEMPDEFLMAIQKHRASLKNPLKTVEEYFETLKRSGLTGLVSHLENFRNKF